MSSPGLLGLPLSILLSGLGCYTDYTVVAICHK